MIHRGPDDSGAWFSDDGRVGLAHRRLSIIDLTSSGHQPMQDDLGKIIIVLNGEIYNYQDLRTELISKGHAFHSQSNTEVIIIAYKEWGIECLSRFVGMFAFALYDKENKKLVIARDRAGEKPLYYSILNNELRFASELKGLLADPAFPRQIDIDSLDLYLSLGYIPGEHCIFKGIKKLPPAHALVFDQTNGNVKIWSYWSLPEVLSKNEPVDKPELLTKLDDLLENAVHMQLQADVPVGVLLSGGVDSSLITAFAARKSKKIKTFNVSFPQFKTFDESSHARLIANYFNTDHIELNADEINPDIIETLIDQFDEPISDSSMIPTYLVSHLVSQHCKVALGGDGGDELFGGYPHYNRLVWMQENLNWIPKSIKNLITLIGTTTLPIGFKGRNWINALNHDLKNELPLIGLFFDSRFRKELVNNIDDPNWYLNAEKIISSRVPINSDLLQRATRMDFSNYLPEDILVKVDRASMLNSLELRSPLLDHRIIEFAYKYIPSNLKASTNNRKILLKDLAKKILPNSFNTKRKQGFSIPLKQWLKSSLWKDYFRDILFDDQAFFDKKAVEKIITGQNLGMDNHERLFSLVLFEKWRKKYKVSL